MSPSPFSRILLAWYDENKRDLPWRRTRDPYRVWLSEVILQQTRIGQGTPYYERFVARYPDVAGLAGASEEEVLKLWQGLGYYSRARNMHQAARVVVERFGGIFPGTWEELRKLKGVGDYTAAAIASICFGESQPVVDGNVVRFFARLFGIVDPPDKPATRQKIRSLALERIDRDHPGDFNQAIMEYGAMVCTPASPGCGSCIFRDDCRAFRENRVAEIPVRTPKAAIPDRFIHYAVITVRHQGSDHIYLNKRTGNDIWKNLYDFPSVEKNTSRNGKPLTRSAFNGLFNGSAPEFDEVSEEFIHVLSHRRIHARFYRFRLPAKPELPFLFVPLKDIHQYPVPRLLEKYILKRFPATTGRNTGKGMVNG
ncbi:MAG TPA: A/G-specific adenine glycosylase [Bacteroidales bacterium]|nr:A/G-specific adenine glycosylase [Bacteroidales bacterium]